MLLAQTVSLVISLNPDHLGYLPYFRVTVYPCSYVIGYGQQ